MSTHRHYKQGDWLYVCQRCGSDTYASRIKQEWNGLRVCPRCYEERHPQDFVRGVLDNQSVPFANPPVTAVFIEVGDVTPDDL